MGYPLSLGRLSLNLRLVSLALGLFLNQLGKHLRVRSFAETVSNRAHFRFELAKHRAITKVNLINNTGLSHVFSQLKAFGVAICADRNCRNGLNTGANFAGIFHSIKVSLEDHYSCYGGSGWNKHLVASFVVRFIARLFNCIWLLRFFWLAESPTLVLAFSVSCLQLLVNSLLGVRFAPGSIRVAHQAKR